MGLNEKTGDAMRASLFVIAVKIAAPVGLD